MATDGVKGLTQRRMRGSRAVVLALNPRIIDTNIWSKLIVMYGRQMTIK